MIAAARFSSILSISLKINCTSPFSSDKLILEVEAADAVTEAEPTDALDTVVASVDDGTGGAEVEPVSVPVVPLVELVGSIRFGGGGGNGTFKKDGGEADDDEDDGAVGGGGIGGG